MFIGVGLLVWLISCVGASSIASSKGRSGFLWFILGVLVGPLAFIVVFLPSMSMVSEDRAIQNGESGDYKKCPFCAEAVRKEAIKCKHCGSELPAPVFEYREATTEKPPEETLAYKAGKYWSRACSSCGITNPTYKNWSAVIVCLVLMVAIGWANDHPSEVNIHGNNGVPDKPIPKVSSIPNVPKKDGTYDARTNVDEPLTTITTGKGKWLVSSDKSPINDSTNVLLMLSAEQAVSSGYNTVTPKLIIRCKEGKTNAYITWDLYLGLDSTTMLTRLDKEAAVTKSWSISTDNKAVFVSGSDIAFAKQLMEHQALLAQITPYGESPVMANFELEGLTEAIKPLREECKW